MTKVDTNSKLLEGDFVTIWITNREIEFFEPLCEYIVPFEIFFFSDT